MPTACPDPRLHHWLPAPPCQDLLSLEATVTGGRGRGWDRVVMQEDGREVEPE
jgi:hypothetical protein